VNVKCDPELSEELRANYSAVKPGYHMNKIHWNTVTFNEDVTDAHLLQMVNDSYNLVVKSLPKKVRESL
jgi:predicted DNA-binding protein (MmcQ/YjbR family)